MPQLCKFYIYEAIKRELNIRLTFIPGWCDKRCDDKWYDKWCVNMWFDDKWRDRRPGGTCQLVIDSSTSVLDSLISPGGNQTCWVCLLDLEELLCLFGRISRTFEIRLFKKMSLSVLDRRPRWTSDVYCSITPVSISVHTVSISFSMVLCRQNLVSHHVSNSFSTYLLLTGPGLHETRSRYPQHCGQQPSGRENLLDLGDQDFPPSILPPDIPCTTTNWWWDLGHSSAHTPIWFTRC
jgi:hypothetical protein